MSNKFYALNAISIFERFLCHGKYCAVNGNGSMPLNSHNHNLFHFFPQSNIPHPFNSTGISTPIFTHSTVLPFLDASNSVFFHFVLSMLTKWSLLLFHFVWLFNIRLCYIAYTVGIVSLSRAHVILQFS